MKKTIQLFVSSKQLLLLLLISTLISIKSTYGQYIPPVNGSECVKCGGKNGVHLKTCIYYNPPKTTSPTPVLLPNTTIEPADVINNLLEFQKRQDAKDEAEAAAEAAKKAIRDANQKRIADSIASLNHNTTKQSLKGLPATQPKNKKNKSYTVSIESKGKFYFLSKEGNELKAIDVNKFTLEDGCKIVTEENARVKILLPDNTLFTVGPNSEIIIDDFVYDTDVSVKTITVSLLKGAFRWITSKVAKKSPGDMTVIIGSGSYAGIRGTNFIAAVKSDESAFVMLFEGEVEIETTGSHEKVILTPGKKVYITADGKIDSIEKFQVMPSDIEPNE